MIDFKNVFRFESYFHILFWSIVFIFPYVQNLGREGGFSLGITHELLRLFFDMLTVYVMYLWFFNQPSKIKLAPLTFLLFISCAALEFYLDGFFHEGEYHNYWAGILSNLLSYMSFTILFFALFSVKQLYLKQQEIDIITIKNQEAELRLLKAQINPHFLFNTLNTIYASALDKAEHTPDLILKLSNNFRYLLSKGQQKTVPLKNELSHIKDFISLQEARLGSKIYVNLTEQVDDYDIEIAPLLFISLVENAFKYTSMLAGSNHAIKIYFLLEDRKLIFTISNPCKIMDSQHLEPQWQRSGVGLNNTRKRLAIMYPNTSYLQVNNDGSIFKATLKIEL